MPAVAVQAHRTGTGTGTCTGIGCAGPSAHVHAHPGASGRARAGASLVPLLPVPLLLTATARHSPLQADRRKAPLTLLPPPSPTRLCGSLPHLAVAGLSLGLLLPVLPLRWVARPPPHGLVVA